jgi:hypothetical protein
MSDALWYADALKLKATGDFCAGQNDWRGAYRNYGSAVEYLLKAIYLRNTQQKAMPRHLQTAASHDLSFMAGHAGLAQAIKSLTGARQGYWLTVRDWDQGRRYPNEPFPAKDGKDLKLALFNPTNGVWSWLLNVYLTN